MLRRVHAERAVGLFYGQRALCIGALSPLNYVGTSEHTAAKATPFKRLAHTASWFEAVMLGSHAEADEVHRHPLGHHRVHLVDQPRRPHQATVVADDRLNLGHRAGGLALG